MQEDLFLLLSVLCAFLSVPLFFERDEIPLLYSGDSAGLVCITGTLYKVSCASALSCQRVRLKAYSIGNDDTACLLIR